MRGTTGLVGALGVAVGLSACAAAPQSITQSDVSPISYDSLNCFDLVDGLAQVDAALVHSSQQQQDSDAAGGASVSGVPASTLSRPDIEPQLGGLEEQRQAIQRAMAQKQCRVTLKTDRVTSWRSKD
jgi:hypothetical protein